MTKQSFSDLALAAYCPRKLYYRRREGDRESLPEAAALRDLALRYERALSPDGEEILAEAPIEVTSTQFRSNLGCAKACLDAWDSVADPDSGEVLLEGREVRGIAHKVLEEPLAPAIISPGEPPEEGVWKPQTVRAVAAPVGRSVAAPAAPAAFSNVRLSDCISDRSIRDRKGVLTEPSKRFLRNLMA